MLAASRPNMIPIKIPNIFFGLIGRFIVVINHFLTLRYCEQTYKLISTLRFMSCLKHEVKSHINDEI